MAETILPKPDAAAVAEHMYRRDAASRGLGMRLIEVGEGSATLEMRVRDDMLNGFAICHGGYITLLADSAFAYACNSGNEVTVASGLSIDFLAKVQGGDLLTARACEVSHAGRTGVYDIAVTNQRGERIALMRGRSHRMKGRPVMAAPDDTEEAS
jgi:acyl-CoA thioesterase